MKESVRKAIEISLNCMLIAAVGLAIWKGASVWFSSPAAGQSEQRLSKNSGDKCRSYGQIVSKNRGCLLVPRNQLTSAVYMEEEGSRFSRSWCLIEKFVKNERTGMCWRGCFQLAQLTPEGAIFRGLSVGQISQLERFAHTHGVVVSISAVKPPIVGVSINCTEWIYVEKKRGSVE